MEKVKVPARQAKKKQNVSKKVQAARPREQPQQQLAPKTMVKAQTNLTRMKTGVMRPNKKYRTPVPVAYPKRGWDQLSLTDRFRLTLEFPGVYQTPYMTPSGLLSKGKVITLHGKAQVAASTPAYQLFLHSPVIGSAYTDRSGFINQNSTVDAGIAFGRSIVLGTDATSTVYGTPAETPGLYNGLFLYSSNMVVVPMVPEANRAGIWYVGSSTIGQLFPSQGGTIGNVSYTFKQLIQLSDAYAMSEFPSIGVKCCVSNTSLAFDNPASGDVAKGGLDERVSWIIAVNTGLNITTGTTTSVGFAIDFLTNAVVMADYASPVAVETLKEPDHIETSKDKDFTDITHPDRWNGVYIVNRKSSEKDSSRLAADRLTKASLRGDDLQKARAFDEEQQRIMSQRMREAQHGGEWAEEIDRVYSERGEEEMLEPGQRPRRRENALMNALLRTAMRPNPIMRPIGGGGAGLKGLRGEQGNQDPDEECWVKMAVRNLELAIQRDPDNQKVLEALTALADETSSTC